MENLSIQYDYSKFPVDKLLYFLDSISIYSLRNSDSVLNARKRIIQILANRYFRNKGSVNLYSVLNKSNPYYLKSEDGLKFILSILFRETQDTTEIPKEYQKDFILFVHTFLSGLDTLSKERESFEFIIDWTLFSKVLDALSNLSLKETSSEVERLGINILIQRIKEDMQKQKKSLKDTEGNNNVLMPLSAEIAVKNEEKIKNLSEFKLVKSKLTKGVVEGILPKFKHYSEKDKIYLANYIKKKNYRYLGNDIPSVDGFYFFSNHLDLVSGDGFFNPFGYFYRWCSEVHRLTFRIDSNGVSNYFKDWYEYYSIKDFKSLFEFIKEFYMSLDGATEDGCRCYLTSCAERLVGLYNCYSYPDLKLFDVVYEYVYPAMYRVVNQFVGYKGKTLTKFISEMKLDYGLVQKNIPYIEGDRVFESFGNRVETKACHSLYSSYSKHLLSVFDCFCPLYSEEDFSSVDLSIKDEQTKGLDVFNGLIDEFYSIIGTLKISVSEIREIKEDKEVGYIYRSYFCKCYKKFSKDWVKELFFDEDALKSLNSCIWGSGNGLMGSFSDMWGALYNIIKDDLNFSNTEDLKSILRWDYYTVIRSVSDIFDRLSKSDPDLDMFITDFFGVSLNEARNNLEYGKQIYEFVQVYYR